MMQNNEKKMSNISLRMRVLGMAAASALLAGGAHAATAIWTSSTAGTTVSTMQNQLWLNSANWSPSLPGSGDIALFNSSAPAMIPNNNTVFLDFADGNIATGAIVDNISASVTKPNLAFNGLSAGTLTLSGATVTVPVVGGTTETVPNTILANTDVSSVNKSLTFASNINISLTGTTNNVLGYIGTSGEKTANSGFPVTTINGNISNASGVAAGLTFLGGGTFSGQGGELLLTGTNTFTGGLTIGTSSATNLQAGEVYFTNPAALPSTGTITVNEQSQLGFNAPTGTTTNYSSGSQTLILNGIGIGKNISGALRPTGGSQANPIQWLGNIQLGTSSVANDGDNGAVLVTVGSAGSWFKLLGNMTGGNFIEQGGGVFDLAGPNNTYGYTQLGNGGIYVEPNSSLGTGNVILFQTSTNNPTITLNNAAQTIASLSSQFTATGAVTVPVNGNGFSQNITLNGTALTITEPTSSTFGYGAILANTSGITNGNTGNGSIIYNSTAGGVLTLTGPNTYSGGTTINAGMLNLANNVPGLSSPFPSALGTGTVTVNKGGILASGNSSVPAGFSGAGQTSIVAVTGGTFSGPLVVNNGGVINPGGGNNGQLFTGPITANAGSIFDFNIASASAGNYSTLNSTGAVTFDSSGNEIVNITGSKLAVGTYDLITGTSIAGSPSNLTLGTTPAGPNRSYALSETGTQVVLTIVNNGVERDWSLGGNSPAVDGPGTWAQGSTNFFQASGGSITTSVPYNNASTADTAFGNGGPGGLITLGSNVAVGGTFFLGSLASGQSYTFGAPGGTNTITTVGGIAASNNTTIAAPLVLGASQNWSIDGGVTLTVSGGVSETGGSATLTKSGNGTVVLTGPGTWSGGTNVSQGTLQTTTAGVPAAGGIINNATLDFDQTTVGTYSGLISGTGSVVISNNAGTGSPSVTLSNASNSYSGKTILTGGTLVAPSVGALGTGDGGIVLSGGTLQAGNNLSFPLTGVGGGSPRTLTLTTNTTSTIDTQNYNVTFNSNITGSGNLNKIGTGTLDLIGVPSTTVIGAVTVSAGVLQIAPPANTPSFGFAGSSSQTNETGTIEVVTPIELRLQGGYFSGGGTLQIDPSNILTIAQNAATTTIGNNIVLNPQNGANFTTMLGANTGSTLAINGAITGNASVDFTGGKGFVLLGGISTYTGSTRIDNSAGGYVQLTTNNALPAATDVTVSSSGTFDLNGFNQSINSLTANSTTAQIVNNSTTTNSVLTITGSASTIYNGVLQDQFNGPTLGLTLSGTGALALPVGELYAGPTSVLGGRLDITGISSADNTTGLGATSAITIGTTPGSMNAQLRFSGVVGTVSYVTANHPNISGPALNPTITLNSLGGYNTSGASFSSGAIRVSSSSALVLPDPIVFAASSVISVTDTSTLTLSGPLSGTGTFISQGTGLLTLTGSNTTYTGGTEIDAGTFNVSTGSALGTGPLAVNNILNTGNGSIGSAVVLNLNNATQTVGSLSGTITAPATGTNTATINLASGTVLTVNQTTAGSFAGTLNGAGGSLVKTGPASLTLAGGVTYTGTTNVSAGSLTFGSNTGTGFQNITSGGISISPGATLALGTATNHSNRTLLTTASLTFPSGSNTSTGTLDLGTNDLNVQNAGSAGLTLITSQIRQGYNNGTWTGTGITSSAAMADSTHLTALGVILNNNGAGASIYGSGTTLGSFDGTSPAPNDVLVKYTYYGDANLSGQVDGSDYTRIDNGYLNHLTGWFNGDFNYDGVVDGSDYTLIDNAFNTQGAALASEIASPSSQIASSGTAAVPEPAAFGALLISGLAMLSRRSKKLRK